MNINTLFLLLIWSCLGCISCRNDEEIIPEDEHEITRPEQNGELAGFYLLNEGNMGSNKATLDYMNLTTGVYHRNIFAAANPNVPKELGDVGNDLRIYGSKLYAVINCSNKVEVMDKFSVKRLGQIDIPNCRYINFHEGYAYLTSYAGPVQINPVYEQTGYVAKIDTATFEVAAQCLVGFQPEEIEIVGEKIYVANSGGYMNPNYENTVSVIDIHSFTEIKRIEVSRNLHRLCADQYGNLWVSSRGDYYGKESRLFRINTTDDTVEDSLEIAVSNFCLDGDSLYICSSEWSNNTMSNRVSYGIVNVATKQIVSQNFITDGTDLIIKKPYGIMVNPVSKDIYITEAGNYVYPGILYCFDANGKNKWQWQTGDIPAHFALLYDSNSSIP